MRIKGERTASEKRWPIPPRSSPAFIPKPPRLPVQDPRLPRPLIHVLRVPEQVRSPDDDSAFAVLEFERDEESDVPRRAREAGALTGKFGGGGGGVVRGVVSS